MGSRVKKKVHCLPLAYIFFVWTTSSSQYVHLLENSSQEGRQLEELEYPFHSVQFTKSRREAPAFTPGDESRTDRRRQTLSAFSSRAKKR